MSKPLHIRIAVTSRRRADLAASFFPPFYFEAQGSNVSTAGLVIGRSDSEIAGIGAPVAVGRKKYEFSFANPAGLALMALRGRGFYKQAIPLRAIGVFPSWDRLVFAVREDTGIQSLDEVKQRKYPLCVSTRRGGRYQGTLFALDEVLKGYGFSLLDIEKWGGKVLRASSPSSSDRREHIVGKVANAVFDEGIKSWGSVALSSGMRFLPIKDSVLKRLERLGFSRTLLTPAEYPKLTQALSTVDFSGWLFFCHRDLESPVAYAMAKAVDLVHQRIPVDHFDRRAMTVTEFCHGGDAGPLTIPLHRGAKKYYEEKGYL